MKLVVRLSFFLFFNSHPINFDFNYFFTSIFKPFLKNIIKNFVLNTKGLERFFRKSNTEISSLLHIIFKLATKVEFSDHILI